MGDHFVRILVLSEIRTFGFHHSTVIQKWSRLVLKSEVHVSPDFSAFRISALHCNHIFNKKIWIWAIFSEFCDNKLKKQHTYLNKKSQIKFLPVFCQSLREALQTTVESLCPISRRPCANRKEQSAKNWLCMYSGTPNTESPKSKLHMPISELTAVHNSNSCLAIGTKHNRSRVQFISKKYKTF